MWNTVIVDPMVNVLIWLYGLMGNSFVLSLLTVTIIINLIVFPLRWKQQKSATAMQELQPKLKKIQEKYKDQPEELRVKTMEVYQQAGVNPVGGCLPMFIQLPILFGLFQALTRSLASSPLPLMELSQHIYHPMPSWLSWLPDAATLIPLNSNFGWLNLGRPDPFYILPVLLFVTTWLQSKMMTPPATDSQQATMSRTMQWIMPVMFGVMSASFPSGLSIYYILTNVIGAVPYVAMGKSSRKNFFGTEDGSFSWRGLLGLPLPEKQSKSRSRTKKK
jgi:YidC/Oxa1 family membrane protein insertase